jgi:hypothetical protein
MAAEHLMGKLYPHYSVTPYPEDTPLPAKIGDTLTCMCNFEEDREAVNMAKRHRKSDRGCVICYLHPCRARVVPWQAEGGAERSSVE